VGAIPPLVGRAPWSTMLGPLRAGAAALCTGPAADSGWPAPRREVAGRRAGRARCGGTASGGTAPGGGRATGAGRRAPPRGGRRHAPAQCCPFRGGGRRPPSPSAARAPCFLGEEGDFQFSPLPCGPRGAAPTVTTCNQQASWPLAARARAAARTRGSTQDVAPVAAKRNRRARATAGGVRARWVVDARWPVAGAACVGRPGGGRTVAVVVAFCGSLFAGFLSITCAAVRAAAARCARGRWAHCSADCSLRKPDGAAADAARRRGESDGTADRRRRPGGRP
jgi:hypothetical protein